MKTQFTAATAMLALAVASIAFAGDIYKWVDEDGNVHYGDKPTGYESERLPIDSRPTNPARVQAQVAAQVEARATARETEAAAAAEGPSDEELQAKADERAEKCDRSREILQRFVTSRRLYREDEAGERVYLDEEQTRAARQRAEDEVDEYCTP